MAEAGLDETHSWCLDVITEVHFVLLHHTFWSDSTAFQRLLEENKTQDLGLFFINYFFPHLFQGEVLAFLALIGWFHKF